MDKKFYKSKTYCKVTFSLPKELTADAKSVLLLGDFNDWDPRQATKMKRLSTGQFKCTLDLEKGKTFHFKYWVDQTQWLNDPEADETAKDPFGGENSVVNTAE
jgi:1,4-alpha-glucan branching enzyme